MGGTLLFIGCLSCVIQDASGWWLWNSPAIEEEPVPLNITVVVGEEVGKQWVNGGRSAWGGEVGADKQEQRSPATPPRWDAGECMSRWGVPELKEEADPAGYVVFSEGREQLGNNRFLLSDGLVIAKALNRTFVEFPMADSRIATPDAKLGLCDYWDCEQLCTYHRILDLRAFRSMLWEGLIPVDGFLRVVSADWEQTLLPGLVTAENITDFFAEYDMWQVIDMNMPWKSGLRRKPVDLLRPNPFYKTLVQDLTDSQKDWVGGRFLAVQWRTETSTGNLTRCYEDHVLLAVEEWRLALGLERHQVYFNTDLVGQASTTYNASVVNAAQGVVDSIRADYPAAMDNAIYDFLQDEEDAGVKAIVSGLASASAGYLLSSSFNGSGCNECQKPHSKYIDLVAEWRFELLGKDSGSVGELFPSVSEESGFAWGVMFDMSCVVVAIGLLGLVGKTMCVDKRLKLT